MLTILMSFRQEGNTNCSVCVKRGKITPEEYEQLKAHSEMLLFERLDKKAIQTALELHLEEIRKQKAKRSQKRTR